jgi:hypothetical protein
MLYVDQIGAHIQAALGRAVCRFRVELHGEMIDVGSGHGDIRTILEHTLGKAATVTAIAPSDHTNDCWKVHAVVSDVVHEILSAGANVAGKRQTAFNLKNYWRDDFVGAAIEVSPQSALIGHREPFLGLTWFDTDRKTIVYVRPTNAPLFIPHFEHLITYPLRALEWRKGYLDVHAAFLRYRGKGLALLGKRRAGKTSLAMHLLSHGAELLGSDMAQIRFGTDGSVTAIAIPHMCRITSETVWDNALLSKTIGSDFDANRDYLSGPLYSHGKYELYEPSLDGVFGRSVCIASMQMDALLFPHFSLETPRQGIVAVAAEAGKARLLDSIEKDRPLADWLPFEEVLSRARREASLRECLTFDSPLIKSYEFSFGRESSLHWEEIDRTIDLI